MPQQDRSGATLVLYFHPFASFCQKVLIALYENDTPFVPDFVDLGNAEDRARFQAVWPIGRFPVLCDEVRGRTVPESTIIIEYLDHYYPGRTRFLPRQPSLALQARLWDRFFDLHIAEPMQKIVTDRLRPPGSADPFGVEAAKALLRVAYGITEREMAEKKWAMGDTFCIADCAAAPALFYADWVMPLAGAYPNLARYLERLSARPSFARVIDEARPYRPNFPQEPRPR